MINLRYNDAFPGGKDREHVRISGGECAVITCELPCDTVQYCSEPSISDLIENQAIMESLQLCIRSNLAS